MNRVAIHEAGHFVAALLYSKILNKHDDIKHVTINSDIDSAGHVATYWHCNPEYWKVVLKGVDDIKEKDTDSYKGFIKDGKIRLEIEIKYCLAGHVSEYLINRGIINRMQIRRGNEFSIMVTLDGINQEEKGFAGHDINTAIEYYSVLKRNVPDQHPATALSKLFKQTMYDILPHMAEIKKVAVKLDEMKHIEGKALEKLKAEIVSKFKVKSIYNHR